MNNPDAPTSKAEFRPLVEVRLRNNENLRIQLVLSPDQPPSLRLVREGGSRLKLSVCIPSKYRAEVVKAVRVWLSACDAAERPTPRQTTDDPSDGDGRVLGHPEPGAVVFARLRAPSGDSKGIL